MYEYETELEELGGRLFATVLIEYDAHHGEPMVLYYSDGSGYPGSPAALEIIAVTVTTIEGDGWAKTREELGDWAEVADAAAQAAVEDELDRGLTGWLLEHING